MSVVQENIINDQIKMMKKGDGRYCDIDEDLDFVEIKIFLVI